MCTTKPWHLVSCFGFASFRWVWVRFVTHKCEGCTGLGRWKEIWNASHWFLPWFPQNNVPSEISVHHLTNLGPVQSKSSYLNKRWSTRPRRGVKPSTVTHGTALGPPSQNVDNIDWLPETIIKEKTGRVTFMLLNGLKPKFPDMPNLHDVESQTPVWLEVREGHLRHEDVDEETHLSWLWSIGRWSWVKNPANYDVSWATVGPLKPTTKEVGKT